MDDESFCYADKQLKAHLLCEECEQRFRKRGEDWVMANCYRGQSDFRFKRILESYGPIETNESGQRARSPCLQALSRGTHDSLSSDQSNC